MRSIGGVSSLMAVFFVTVPAVQGDIIDNLVSYWKLDETSGTTTGDAQNNNDGTLTASGFAGGASPGSCVRCSGDVPN